MEGSDKERDSSQKRRTTIRWDEETIAEHDKLRGSRQKIDEPPTPYHEYQQETDDEMMSDGSGSGRNRAGSSDLEEGKSAWTEATDTLMRNSDSNRGGAKPHSVMELKDNWDQVEAKLADHQARFVEGAPARSTWDDADVAQAEDDEEEKRRKAEEFRKKRAQHYNEFQRLQEWRKQHEEDEDDEDEDGSKIQGHNHSNCNGNLDESGTMDES
mmetsp:Transcript_10/g.10  ORF Transcript_10/g.10 Transcript_10/m.10 type:complete len:213 (+) Transcript_10:57-695(+)